MNTATKTSEAKERILDKAEELFYRQGYQATGINQIIDESGVAKATFYAHFPSKDDLCLSYLKRVGVREFELLDAELQKRKTPLTRFMCGIEMLEPWLVETDMKGCAFLNMVPEVIDAKHPIRQEGIYFYKKYEALVRTLAADLIQSDTKKYGHLKPEKLAKDYMIIFAGSIALCEMYHDIAPVKQGTRMVQELLI